LTDSLKLASVQYLNAEPLVWPLEQHIIDHNHSIVKGYPGEIAGMLIRGEVDCALAPVAVLLDCPDLIPVPDVAIACRGAVASVLLFHNEPIQTLTTILLDPHSRTSNLLMRILRAKVSKTPCEFTFPDLNDNDTLPDVTDLPEYTGRMVIGDQALLLGSQNSITEYITDLGALWKELTNHPFTFARWIARTGDIAAQLTGLLRDTRDWSVLNLHSVIDVIAEKHGFEPSLVDRYLRLNVTYMFGPREEAGMHEFFRLAKMIDGVVK
jgi:chorismate dehydratase